MKNILIATLFLLPTLGLAQTDYTPLAPIPELTNGGDTTNINTFIPGAIRLTIGVASGLAVLFIIIGGIQYMSSDAWNKKEDGKKTIQNALGGLLLAIGSYVILNTVNPQLLNFDITIEGQSGGQAIDPNMGQTTALGPEELGCDDCEEIPVDEITMRIGACNNNPCYVNEDLLDDLVNRLKPWLQENASSTWRAFQIIRAFPNTASSTSSIDSCLRLGSNGLGGDNAGTCVDIALTVLDIQRIRGLLDGVGSQVQHGYTYHFYNACGSRLIELRNNVTYLNVFPNSLFQCHFPEKGEFLRIYRGTRPS